MYGVAGAVPAAVGHQISPAGRQIDIAIGKSAQVPDTDLVVRFDRVIADSRCPTDAQCIVAGDATVVIRVAVRRAAFRRYQLHTNAEPRVANHKAYAMTLVDLRPLPSSTRPVRARDYVVTLHLERR